MDLVNVSCIKLNKKVICDCVFSLFLCKPWRTCLLHLPFLATLDVEISTKLQIYINQTKIHIFFWSKTKLIDFENNDKIDLWHMDLNTALILCVVSSCCISFTINFWALSGHFTEVNRNTEATTNKCHGSANATYNIFFCWINYPKLSLYQQKQPIPDPSPESAPRLQG